MTFASEAVRMLFHQLPTEVQVDYTDWENRLADRGQSLRIEGVMNYDRSLEIIIRITENIKPVFINRISNRPIDN